MAAVDVKALTADMEGALQEMEGIRAKIAEAEEAMVKAESDEDKQKHGKTITQAQALFAEKKAMFETYKGKVQEAREHAERMALLDEVKGLGAPKDRPSGKTPVPGDGPPAEPFDHDREEREELQAFGYYMQPDDEKSGPEPPILGKKLRVTSDRFKQGKGGIRLPRSCVGRLFGKSYSQECPCNGPRICPRNVTRTLSFFRAPASGAHYATSLPRLAAVIGYPSRT